MEICEYCGKEIPDECNGILNEVTNPFLYEIYNEVKIQWLCDGQYYMLCDEI